MKIEEGQKIEEAESPIRKGYNFCRWYLDETYKKMWDFETDQIASDLVLHAKWEKSGKKEILSIVLNVYKDMNTSGYTGESANALTTSLTAAEQKAELERLAAQAEAAQAEAAQKAANEARAKAEAAEKAVLEAKAQFEEIQKQLSGAGAFKGNTKATSAFKGIYKKAVIKVPVAKYKTYRKLLAKKGQSKSVKIKK